MWENIRLVLDGKVDQSAGLRDAICGGYGSSAEISRCKAPQDMATLWKKAHFGARKNHEEAGRPPTSVPIRPRPASTTVCSGFAW